ncbi:MAG: DnaJ domain-containing protein [Burkholderiaceae bacterium]
MSRNRRNYYRILGVQPDSPQELIRASYRTLMSTMRRHPDLGGDHETAAMINEAWAVLGDPARRQAYDRANPHVMSYRRERAGPQAGHAGSGGRPGAAGVHGSQGQRSAQAAGAGAAGPTPARAPAADPAGCPMCATALPAVIQPQTRCLGCASPLALPRDPGGRCELFGRRGTSRTSKNTVARMRLAGSVQTAPVVVADLSLNGIGLITRDDPGRGAIVRVRHDEFDVVAEILHSRRVSRGYALNARLLRALFETRTGLFVSCVA